MRKRGAIRFSGRKNVVVSGRKNVIIHIGNVIGGNATITLTLINRANGGPSAKRKN